MAKYKAEHVVVDAVAFFRNVQLQASITTKFLDFKCRYNYCIMILMK